MHVHELADYNDNDNSLMSLTSTLSIHVHELADYNDNDNSLMSVTSTLSIRPCMYMN